MPRIGRLHIEGGFYHLMGRGLERRYIFTDDEDKADFVARFASGLENVVERSLGDDRLRVDAPACHLQLGWDVRRLVEAVSHHFDVEVTRITDMGRRNDLSMSAVICYPGTKEPGLSGTVIGSALATSRAAVSRSVRRGRAVCAEHGVARKSHQPDPGRRLTS
jgi:hypothetical protein